MEQEKKIIPCKIEYNSLLQQMGSKMKFQTTQIQKVTRFVLTQKLKPNSITTHQFWIRYWIVKGHHKKNMVLYMLGELKNCDSNHNSAINQQYTIQKAFEKIRDVSSKQVQSRYEDFFCYVRRVNTLKW